jgi:hypothetical protein
MLEDECEFLTTKSAHLVSRGQNPLKLLYSIMILNTISLASQGKANKPV